MVVVSMRDFRSEQTKYLRMIKQGEDVVLKSRKEGSFKLSLLTDDDRIMSKEEYFAMIDKSRQQAKEGKTHKMQEGENIEEFVNRLLCTE